MSTFWINDAPIEDYGLDVLRGSRGWLDGLALSYQAQPIPGSFGQLLDADGFTADARVLELAVQMRPASLAVRKLILSTLYQLSTGLVQIRANDTPDRFIEAKLMAAIASGDLIRPQCLGTLRFVAVDPRFFASALSCVHVPPGVRTPIPLGEAGARVNLYLSGILTSSVVTIRSGRTGETLGTMTLSGTLSTAQWLRLRLDRRQLVLGSGNPAAETDAYSWKGTSDMWATLEAGDQPDLTISAGDGLILSRRAYPV